MSFETYRDHDLWADVVEKQEEQRELVREARAMVQERLA